MLLSTGTRLVRTKSSRKSAKAGWAKSIARGSNARREYLRLRRISGCQRHCPRVRRRTDVGRSDRSRDRSRSPTSCRSRGRLPTRSKPRTSAASRTCWLNLSPCADGRRDRRLAGSVDVLSGPRRVPRWDGLTDRAGLVRSRGQAAGGATEPDLNGMSYPNLSTDGRTWR
jgi:hypothetical protein